MKRYSRCGMKAVICSLALLLVGAMSATASHAQIVALGASNGEGYGVSAGEAFPAVLEAMLRAKGRNYSVNAQGVFGDTTSGVLGRLDSAVPEGTRTVILLIGGNDIRKGGTMQQAKAGYGEIASRLKARHIRVINAGPYYQAARKRGLTQGDGIHLTAAGHRYLASELLPLVN